MPTNTLEENVAKDESHRKSKAEPLWKEWNRKATKSGPHHTVYWVKYDKSAEGEAREQEARYDDEKTIPGSFGTVYDEELDEMAAKKLQLKVAKGQNGPSRNFMVGAKYTGEWLNGQKHGFGAQVWSSGNKYEGEWKNNKRHGKGTMWVVASTQSGKKKKSKEEMEGQVLRKQYTGDWVDGMRHGLGIFYYANGSRYEGHWEENMRQGKGRLKFGKNSSNDNGSERENGGVYEGDWQGDMREGLGAMLYANGDRYEGHWNADRKEGPGRYYYASTGKIYEGEWCAGSAKCGEFKDDPFEDKKNHDFRLPELTLSDPGVVLGNQIARVRQERLQGEQVYSLASSSLTKATVEETKVAQEDEETIVFSEDQLSSIRDAFERVAAKGEGEFIPCRDILLAISYLQGSHYSTDEDSNDNLEQDVAELLEELGASYDTRVAFPEFTEILSLLCNSRDIYIATDNSKNSTRK